MSYSDVRDADDKGHMAFMRVVAALIGKYADDDAQRDRVLAPVLAQNDAIGEAYRRRRAIPDVDPNTGEPTEPPVEA